MPSAPQQGPWLAFSMLTVLSWGLYGYFLFKGTLGMADPANGRLKAFLFVGIAYFLVAILAPALLLILSGANFKYPAAGMSWSLLAGIVGAIGAFGVLLAYGAGGLPAVVMTIIFAGAPLINSLVFIWLNPPVGGWAGVDVRFWLGLLLAVSGGALVTYYRPAPAKPIHHGPPPAAAPAATAH